jgi:hypothetical protein
MHYVTRLGLFAVSLLILPASAFAQTGQEVYESVCANCHGMTGFADGPAVGALITTPANFGDCSFASREPDSDWIDIALHGGATRGFSTEMPAHAESLSRDQIESAIAYIRTLCSDDRWPRGELNLPRPLVTEKAYPEDEAVITTTVAMEGRGAVVNELLYEKRFGPLSQIEVKLPFGLREQDDGDWRSGIGDLTLGVKHTLFHSYEAGSILSAGGEVKLPIGNETDGFSKGATVLEAFVSFGQILPNDYFLHAQAIGEFVTDGDKGDPEAKWRAVLGRTWTNGEFGRAWSPMVEILGTAEFSDPDTEVRWDIVPQMQVTLNKRQHIMLNAGAVVPLTQADERSTRLMIYLLWDWFDGGFFEGW